MPDQRSVMKEYRTLDEKRLAGGLTPDEEARFAYLRELVGPETAASITRPGFDVNAAAAALRESLLPAGLRNRPPPTPVPAPPPTPEPEPSVADALASVYEQAPFAPMDDGAAQPADTFFDPASLGAEQPAYDAAAQGYDPNAAYPADAAYDPGAQPAWDPNQPWDPDAPAGEPPPPDAGAAYPADAAYDPGAQPEWDPNQPWDPGAPAGEPPPPDAGAAYPADAYDPGAQPEWDPNQPWDPGAPAGEPPPDAGAASAEVSYDPNAPDAAEAQVAFADVETIEDAELVEAEPLPGDAAPPDGGSFEAGDSAAPAGWDAEPPPPEPTTNVAFGEYDAAGEPSLVPVELAGAGPSLDAEPAPLEPLEPAHAEAAPSGIAPTAAELGEYDDTAGFTAEPFDLSAVPENAPGLDAGPPLDLDAAFQPDAVLEGGFELASGGSFGAGADAAAPEWAQAAAPPPWEGAPPLELTAPPEQVFADDATGYELSPAPAGDAFAGRAPGSGDLFAPPEGDLAPPEVEPAPEPGPAPAAEFDDSSPDFSTPDGAEPEPAAAATAEPPAEELFGAPPEELLAEAGPEGTAAYAADLAEVPEPAVSEAATATAPAVGDSAPEAPAEPPAEAAAPAAPEPDLSFDVAEEVPAETFLAEAAPLEPAAEISYPEAAPPEPAAEISYPEAAPPEPAAEVSYPEAAPLEPAAEVSYPEAAPAAAEDDVPTIDGADILEEIVDQHPAPSAHSLEFEPLPPEPTAAPPPPEPAPEIVAPAAPAPGPVSPLHVAGSHRVVVHTMEGLVKRGMLEEADLDAPTLSLASPGAPAEDVATEKVKAIFFMRSLGEKPPAPEGVKVRVTFRDGRQIAGFSPDYRDEGIGFFMIPADTKTNTGRIWVFRTAVRQVTIG